MKELSGTESKPTKGALKYFIAALLLTIVLAVIGWYFSIDLSRCDGHKCIIEKIAEVYEWGNVLQITVIHHPYKGKRQEVRVKNTKKSKKILDKLPAAFPNLKKLFNDELNNINDYLDTGKQPETNIIRHYEEEYEHIYACPDRCYCKQVDFIGKSETKWSVMTIKRETIKRISYEIWVEYKGRHNVFEGECIEYDDD